MKKTGSQPNCTYPDWLISSSRFLSFNFKQLYTFSDDGLEMKLSNYSYSTKAEALLAKASCIDMLNETENFVKLITRKDHLPELYC